MSSTFPPGMKSAKLSFWVRAARSRNDMVPRINTIPAELLEMIFISILEGLTGEELHRARRSIRAVCASWRRLAFFKPQFWSLLSWRYETPTTTDEEFHRRLVTWFYHLERTGQRAQSRPAVGWPLVRDSSSATTTHNETVGAQADGQAQSSAAASASASNEVAAASDTNLQGRYNSNTVPLDVDLHLLHETDHQRLSIWGYLLPFLHRARSIRIRTTLLNSMSGNFVLPKSMTRLQSLDIQYATQPPSTLSLTQISFILGHILRPPVETNYSQGYDVGTHTFAFFEPTSNPPLRELVYAHASALLPHTFCRLTGLDANGVKTLRRLELQTVFYSLPTVITFVGLCEVLEELDLTILGPWNERMPSIPELQQALDPRGAYPSPSVVTASALKRARLVNLSPANFFEYVRAPALEELMIAASGDRGGGTTKWQWITASNSSHEEELATLILPSLLSLTVADSRDPRSASDLAQQPRARQSLVRRRGDQAHVELDQNSIPVERYEPDALPPMSKVFDLIQANPTLIRLSFVNWSHTAQLLRSVSIPSPSTPPPGSENPSDLDAKKKDHLDPRLYPDSNVLLPNLSILRIDGLMSGAVDTTLLTTLLHVRKDVGLSVDVARGLLTDREERMMSDRFGGQLEFFESSSRIGGGV